jgi:hypothetical protein
LANTFHSASRGQNTSGGQCSDLLGGACIDVHV